jgi:hypothetical protein
MADNIQVTPGSGPSVAADDVGGVLYQRIKPAFGADGSATDVSAANPLPVTAADRGEYEFCAASVTTVLGATGAVGDFLDHVLIVPGNTSPGAVQIRDGSAGTARTIFTGGASSVSNLASIDVNIGAVATAAGGWAIITGANVTAFGFGNFS